MSEFGGVVFLLASMALLPLLAHMLPRLSRPGVFFAVTVPSGFPETQEGLRILRRFRRRVWSHFVLGSSVTAAGVLRDRPWLVAAGMVWLVGRVLWAFWAAHRQSRPHAAS